MSAQRRQADPPALRATQRFQIYARGANQAPFALPGPGAPGFSVAARLTFRYDVKATDPDGDSISFDFPCVGNTPGGTNCAPVGMTIDRFGRITWPTTDADIDADKGDADNDPYTIDVLLRDDRGASFKHTFQVTVLPDTAGPKIDLRLDPNPAKPNEPVLALVSAVDSVGVTDLRLVWCQLNTAQPPQCIATPVNLPLDAHGIATISFSQISDFKFTATATDAAGNSASVSDVLAVFDTDDVLAPDVAILSLRIGNDPETDVNFDPGPVIITDPWNVVGTVTDAENNLTSWTLAIAPVTVQVGSEERAPNDSDFRTIRAVTCSLTPDLCPLTSPSIVGELDPTMLPNGPYTLRLTATDAGLHTASTEVTVQITGNLKLGNFTLSFTDLSIPVSGIPITITRSYDTLRANEPGDFGYGWRMEMWDADVKVDEATLGLSGFSVFRPFLKGTRVTVTATGGKPESYTFDPKKERRHRPFVGKLGKKSKNPSRPILSMLPQKRFVSCFRL